MKILLLKCILGIALISSLQVSAEDTENIHNIIFVSGDVSVYDYSDSQEKIFDTDKPGKNFAKNAEKKTLKCKDKKVSIQYATSKSVSKKSEKHKKPVHRVQMAPSDSSSPFYYTEAKTSNRLATNEDNSALKKQAAKNGDYFTPNNFKNTDENKLYFYADYFSPKNTAEKITARPPPSRV